MTFHLNSILEQAAKDRGATIVRDIWEDSDGAGTVRFATVQTVRSLESLTFHLSKIFVT